VNDWQPGTNAVTEIKNRNCFIALVGLLFVGYLSGDGVSAWILCSIIVLWSLKRGTEIY
jgi:fatty acid desaturase